MSKTYTQAPLSFMGQKRYWNRQYKQVLKDLFTDCHTFIDLFGGSGLLSHFTKVVRPDATVVYNDYDGYVGRLQAISETNTILHRLRAILHDYPRDKRIVEPLRSQVIAVLEQAEHEFAAVDYISLSNSLLFAAKYATTFDELKHETMYNRIRKDDFSADGYLDGITVVHQDYRDLLNQYNGTAGVCFIADPPYLSTQTKTYRGYWKLRDYLDVLHTLHDTNYFYFTSEKSSILELCEWLDDEYQTGNPFKGATRIDYATNLNYSAGFIDIMLYKHQPQNERRKAIPN